MTEGKVVSLGADICRGWAKIVTLPRYAVTVHLVVYDRVVASAIADRSSGEIDDHSASDDCWFEIGVPSEAATLLADCRVLVGESGTYLSDGRQDGRAEAASPASAQAPASFREALNKGLSASDVIELLYLDILRRPADKVGFRFHMDELESGRGSLESFRRSLLESGEYRRLALRVRDAPGGSFARGIACLSSSRRVRMERHAAEFQRLDVPLHRKLLDFLPGIVMKPNATETLLALAEKGLPHREIFFRALSALSRQPSLILAGRCEPSLGDHGGTDLADSQEITITCASPQFVQGWYKIERSSTKTFRWMEQIGILLNPWPERKIERFEVEIADWYGNLDRSIIAVAGGTVLVCERRETEGGSATLIFTTPDGAPTSAPQIALVAGAVACPSCYDGTPDMRLLSCQVTIAKFRFEGEAA